MASRINKYGVDYLKIAVNAGGVIELDTGSAGETILLGDLTVEGTTTTINSIETNIQDRIVTLNDGETGSTVSSGDNTSGIRIDRGIGDSIDFLWDENTSYLNPAGPISTGSFVFKNNNSGALIGIKTNSITTNNTDLYLINDGPNIVSVTGTVDYEKQIWSYTGSSITTDAGQPDGLVAPSDPDILVNVQALKDYVSAVSTTTFQTSIASPPPSGSTRVDAFSIANGDANNEIRVTANGTSIASFLETEIDLDNLQITGQTLTTTVVNGDVNVNANGTGSLATTTPVNLKVTTDPVLPSDGIKVYAKLEGEGETGLFFINQSGTTDEFISKSKSLLYSILF